MISTHFPYQKIKVLWDGILIDVKLSNKKIYFSSKHREQCQWNKESVQDSGYERLL